LQEHESLSATTTTGIIAETASGADGFTSTSGFTCYSEVLDKSTQASRQKKTRTINKKNSKNVDWDELRRQACDDGYMKERKFDRRDSVNWEAVRCADVHKISNAIRERGMNNVLAEQIKVLN
jgi:predicted deacylase